MEDSCAERGYMGEMTQDEARRQAHYEKMTQTPVPKLVTTLAIPTIISMMVSAIYNMADTFFVSQLGTSAVGAVGIVFSLMAIIQAIGFTLGMGSGTIVSLHLGAKEEEKATCAASTGFFSAIVLGLALTVFGSLFVEPLMQVLGATETILPYARDYGQYILLAAPIMCASFVMNNIFRCEGKSVLGMLGIGTGGILNIILDPILIFGLFGFPRLEVRGAAIATVIGQIAACLMSFFFNLKKNKEININMRHFRPQRETIAAIYKVGVPSIIMQAISSVMTFGMNKILLMFSSTAAAVFGVYFKLQSFVFMPVFGLNNGMIPIIAYNYGAQNKKRITRTIKLSIIIAVSIMIVGLIVFQVAPGFLLRNLFDASDRMLEIGIPALRIISLSFVFAGYSIVASSVFQALGNGVYSLIVSAARQLFVILPLAYIFSITFGLHMIWWAIPIAEIVSLILCTVLLFRIYRLKIKPIKN